MGCAIAGAIVMSVDFSIFSKDEITVEETNENLIDENGFINDDHMKDTLK